MPRILLLVAMVMFGGAYAQAAEPAQPVVLELFTSQSCSSCPPADALLKELSADPTLLALSFHVHYWDHLGWKDTYSSPVYTDRQRAYAQALGESGVFTPQLIVNGTISVVGSDEGDVKKAIAIARHSSVAVNVSLASGKAGQMVASIAATKSPMLKEADIWEIQFDRYAKTSIGGGENGGRTLESINNVTSIKSLGTWRPADGTKTISLDDISGEGIAVIVQVPQQGQILGAAYYVK